MKKVIIVICCLIVLSYETKSQIRFSKPPIIKETKDSLIYELKDSLIYNYFSQKFITECNTFAYNFIIPFDSTMKYNESYYYQKAIINKTNKNGWLYIYFLDYLLFKYEIRNNNINGIAIVYYLFEGTPASIGVFNNGNLDGVSIQYLKNGDIESIQLFKRGRYLKYIYHRLAQSNKALRKANKKLKNPYLEIDFKKNQIR